MIKVKRLVMILGAVVIVMILMKFVDPLLLQTAMVTHHKPSPPAVKRAIEIDDFWPLDTSFYFIETSGKSSINPRFACSIESAARHHPNANIYVGLEFFVQTLT